MFLKRFRQNKRAESLTGKIIGISIGLMIASVMLVQGVSNVINANVTGWDATVANMFQVLVPMIAIIALVILLLKSGGIKSL